MVASDEFSCPVQGRPQVEVWTDGSAASREGHGGWAAVIEFRGRTLELSGYAPAGDSNHMELLAVVQALRKVPMPATVTVHTDSAYVADTVGSARHSVWVSDGARTRKGTPVASQELWRELLLLCARHEVTVVKVKGHSGVAANERADRLAGSARRRRAGQIRVRG